MLDIDLLPLYDMSVVSSHYHLPDTYVLEHRVVSYDLDTVPPGIQPPEKAFSQQALVRRFIDQEGASLGRPSHDIVRYSHLTNGNRTSWRAKTRRRWLARTCIKTELMFRSSRDTAVSTSRSSIASQCLDRRSRTCLLFNERKGPATRYGATLPIKTKQSSVDFVPWHDFGGVGYSNQISGERRSRKKQRKSTPRLTRASTCVGFVYRMGIELVERGPSVSQG
ncbi:uncharacterized protein LY79DRAFT_552451 [Colletotrichum navitas]|uniref:Uncharacterized protein n=1 Tax=Colletotrichum navitas TaxID=681940 RepID=A0AAD8Q039_9PEZI|nr:uncharacterized protein LY79DRAFT_552451 [Colletotrichum navitas]KAK1593318.1 hypothetical protein LY79DRAFT_552451 [Colletotrichum navitas]